MDAIVIVALWVAASVFVLWVGSARFVLQRWEARQKPAVPAGEHEITAEELLRLEADALDSALQTLRESEQRS